MDTSSTYAPITETGDNTKIRKRSADTCTRARHEHTDVLSLSRPNRTYVPVAMLGQGIWRSLSDDEAPASDLRLAKSTKSVSQRTTAADCSSWPYCSFYFRLCKATISAHARSLQVESVGTLRFLCLDQVKLSWSAMLLMACFSFSVKAPQWRQKMVQLSVNASIEPDQRTVFQLHSGSSRGLGDGDARQSRSNPGAMGR